VSVAGNKVLIVDGQEGICALFSEYLKSEGMIPVVAHTAAAGLEKVRTVAPDLLIVDLELPDMGGIEAMKAAKALAEDLPTILVTGNPNIREAVAAIRAGAHGYLEKPLKHHEVLRVIFRALNESGLQRKLRRLSSQAEDAASLRESMGPSQAVTRLIAEVTRVAKTNFSVLILGETGAGKDLVAGAIHRLSARARGPFVAVDCGAIPETLIEGELFGYEKGAFTGADKQKSGKFEMAGGGTFFLDEVCNMPPASQAKLLRVLQDKTIHRIGSTRPIDVDVRVLAASNRDLRELTEAEAGSFRRDVYFRLNEFTIQVPPLRERRDDILYLAKRFVDLTNVELQKEVRSFTQPAVDRLLAYPWPGNVRQLRSMIRRAVLVTEDTISEQHLAFDDARPAAADIEGAPGVEIPPQGDCSLKEIVQHNTALVERQILARVLRQTGGNKAEAARLLHIDYKTIHLKIKVYGLQTPRHRARKGDF
jgi:DNA-binding NtrC family response regulator